MSDLVQWLRERAAANRLNDRCVEAADALDVKDAEIARLCAERDEAINDEAEMAAIQRLTEAENARLREALKWAMSNLREPYLIRGQNDTHYNAWHAARAALLAERGTVSDSSPARQPMLAAADYPCPNCHSRNHEQRIAPDLTPDFVGAEVPIRHCLDCGEEWEDERTFSARNALRRKTDASAHSAADGKES